MGTKYLTANLLASLEIMYSWENLCRESVDVCYVPNGGFLDDVVIEDPALVSAMPENDLNDTHYVTVKEDEGDLHDVSEANADVVIDTSASADMPNVSEEIATDMSGLHVTENAAGEEPGVEKETTSLSSEDVDFLLDKCLLQALHRSVKDKDLPMPGSTLW